MILTNLPKTPMQWIINTWKIHQNFAYRLELSSSVFFSVSVISFLLSLLSVAIFSIDSIKLLLSTAWFRIKNQNQYDRSWAIHKNMKMKRSAGESWQLYFQKVGIFLKYNKLFEQKGRNSEKNTKFKETLISFLSKICDI